MALAIILQQHLDKDHLSSFGGSLYTTVIAQASMTETSPGVFGHYAAEWFSAMMSAVLGNAEEAAEEGIHILLLDVCLTCLNWHALFPALHKGSPSLSPQVKVAADALMDYLVS